MARLRLSSGSGREVRMTLLITGSPARHPHTCLVLSHSVVPDSVQPRGLQPARPLCPWDPPNKNTGVGCHAHPPGDLPNLGIKSRLPALQADSVLSEPPGKPNTGVGSLSLLQGYLPDPGIKLVSPALHADSLPVELPGKLYYVCVLVTQSFPTLCNPMDCSPPGSSVHEILQARILEWVAMPSSRGSSQPRE